MADRFNVDAGVRPAPQLSQGPGSIGANIDVGSSLAQTMSGIGSLFAGVNERLAQQNRNNIRSGVVESGNQVVEGSLNQLPPANPDANRGGATGPGTNNVGGSGAAGVVSTPQSVEAPRPAPIEGAEVQGPMPAVGIEQRKQELSNSYSAFQQGKLSKANFFGMLDAAFRSDVNRFGRANAELIAKDYKTLFGYSPGDYQKAFFEEQEKQQQRMDKEQERWLQVEKDAQQQGISQDEILAARQDPSRRLDIERRAGHLKSEMARREIALKTMEQDEKLGKLDQEKVFDEAVRTQHNLVTNTFSEIVSNVENRTGVSIADFTKKRQQAMADGVIDAKEAQELVAMSTQLKTAVSQARMQVMGPFEAKIKDRSRVAQLRSEFDSLVKEYITDPIENGNTGVLALNGKVVDSAKNGDAFAVMQQSPTLRKSGAVNTVGGQAAVQMFFNQVGPEVKKEVMAAPLKGIGTDIGNSKPLNQSIENNTNHLKPEDKAAVVNGTLSAIQKTMMNPRSTPEAVSVMAEAVFGEGNADFSKQFTPESKLRMFSILVNPEMTRKMQETAKENPKALEAYQKWSFTTFENVFRDQMRVLSGFTTTTSKSGSLNVPQSQRVVLGFENGRFVASANTTIPASQLTRPIGYDTVDPASRAMIDSVNKMNKALDSLESVASTTNEPVSSVLDRMFSSVNIGPEERSGMAMVAAAFRNSQIAGGTKAKSGDGGNEGTAPKEEGAAGGGSSTVAPVAGPEPEFNVLGERRYTDEKGNTYLDVKLPNGEIYTQMKPAGSDKWQQAPSSGSPEPKKTSEGTPSPTATKPAVQAPQPQQKTNVAAPSAPVLDQSFIPVNQRKMEGDIVNPNFDTAPVQPNSGRGGGTSSSSFSTGRGSGSSMVSGTTGVSSSFINKVMGVESNGNPNARPKDKNGKLLSSAVGLFQFIDTTWKGLMKRYPELGLTADGRTDPEQQKRAMVQFTKDNEAYLRKNGLPVTEGTLYLAHFAGNGGAKGILDASADTPVEQILKPEAIKANEFLRGKTAGWVVRWAERKMNK